MLSLLFLRFAAFIACFVALLTVDSSTNEKESPNLFASLQYEYPDYNCSAQEAVMVLSLRTANLPDEKPSLSLTSVVDTSGSMLEYNRMKLVQATNRFLVEVLRKEEGKHEFGIVTFSSHAHVLAPLVPVTNITAEKLSKKIDKMKSKGKTALLDGVRTGVQQQGNNTEGNYVQAVFISTDGVPKGGVTDPVEILNGIRDALGNTDRKIVLYTFGLGTSLSLDLLEDIAELGDGVRYIVPHEEDIAVAFGNALGGLLTTAARDIRIHLLPEKDAKIVEVKSGGNVTHEDDGSFEIAFGNLFFGERRDVLVKLSLPDSCSSGSYLQLKGKFITTQNFKTVNLESNTTEINRSEKPPEYAKGASLIGVSVLRHDIAELLDEASTQYSSSDITGGVATLKEVQKYISKSPFKDDEFALAVQHDVQILIGKMETDTKVGTERQTEIDGIRDAVSKQRTGLTDATTFKLVNFTRTESQQSTGEDATKAVKIEVSPSVVPPKPPSPSPPLPVVIPAEPLVEPPEASMEEEPVEPSVEPPVETMEEELAEPPEVEIEESIIPVEPPEEASMMKPVPPFEFVLNYSIVDENVAGEWKQFDIVLSLDTGNLTTSNAPLSLTTVLDQSASMEGTPFEFLKDTQKFVIDTFLQQKNAELSLGMVFFSDEAHAFLPLKEINEIDVEKLKRLLDEEETGGQTALSDGLFLGIDQQAKKLSCSGSHVVFLFTDGKPTNDSDLPEKLKPNLNSLAEEILIYTFGLGDGVDEQLLHDISRVGGGRFYFLKTSQDIPSSFGDALGGLLSLAAKNITLSIFPSYEAEIVDVFPKGRVDNGLNQIVFDDLFIEEKRDVLVTVRVPKHQEIPQILDFMVSYTHIVTCDVLESALISVEYTTTTPSGKIRVIEAEVVQYLEEAEVVCRADDASKAIDILTEAIVFVSESSESVNQSFVEDLIKDLTKLKSKCQNAAEGVGSLADLTTDIQNLKETLQTQRSTSVGHTGFHVEPYYDTEARKQLRNNFSQDINSEHTRPRIDAITIQHEGRIEVVDTDTEIILPLEIVVMEKPTNILTPPTYATYVVDATQNTTKEDLEKAKEFIIKCIEFYSKSTVAKQCFVTIVVITSEVKTVITLVKASKIKAEEIETIFASIKPEGNVSLIEGIGTSLKSYAGLSKEKDFVVYPIAGGSVLDEDGETAGKTIDQMVKNFSCPITIVPVSSSAEVTNSYFGKYPSWCQSHTCLIDCKDCISDALENLNQTLISIAAKQILLKFNLSENVTLVSVDEHDISTEVVYVIADAVYGKKVSLKLKIQLESHEETTQPLFIISPSLYDMRSFHNWDLDDEPYVIVRVNKETLEKRIMVRERLSEVLTSVEDYIEDENYEDCDRAIIKELAIIESLKSDDPAIQQIQDSLEEILTEFTELENGETDKKKVKVAIEVLKSKLNVQSYSPETQLPEDEETGEEVEAERKPLSIPPNAVYGMKTWFSTNDQTTNSPHNWTANFTLLTPPSDGKSISARCVFIVDTSVTADLETNVKITRSLLEQLAQRDGNRKVEILSWNRGVVSIFKSEKLITEEITQAVKALEDKTLVEDCLYHPVIDHGFDFAHSAADLGLEVVFWIVSSNYEDDEDSHTLIETAGSKLKSALASVTIFSFYSNLKTEDSSVVKEISKLSGGQSFAIDNPDQVAYFTRKAVYWMDTVVYKNVEIYVEPDHAVNLTKVFIDSKLLDLENGIVQIPSLQCDAELETKTLVEFEVEVDWSTGVQELLRITGNYFNVKTKNLEYIKKDTYLIERLSAADDKKILKFQNRIDEILGEAQIALGDGNIPEVLHTLRQCHIHAKFSGLNSTYLIEETKIAIKEVIVLLEECTENGYSVEKLVLAEKLINELKEAQGAENESESKVLTLREEDERTYSQKNGTIEVPVWLHSPKSKEDFVPGNLSLTVVLDTADHKTAIHQSESVLAVQKDVLTKVITKLTEEEQHQIDVTIITHKKLGLKIKKPLQLTKDNLEDLEKTLEKIKPDGEGGGMMKGLETSLIHQAERLNTNQRTIMIFAEASSVCCLSEDEYTELYKDYSHPPINPIRVLTYIVGKRGFPTTNDPLSALSGGMRFFLGSALDIDPVVDVSSKVVSKSICCGIKVAVTPLPWLKENLTFPSFSYVQRDEGNYIVTVPDLPIGESLQMKIGLQVGDWNGRVELFETSLSCFRTDLGHWITEPKIIVSIDRANKEIISERTELEDDMKTISSKIDDLLARQKVEEAREFIETKLKELDQMPHQDDIMTLKVVGRLMKILDLINQALSTNYFSLPHLKGITMKPQ